MLYWQQRKLIIDKLIKLSGDWRGLFVDEKISSSISRFYDFAGETLVVC